MLAWWDEPSEDLYACVTSMAVLCDAVVAVDGAYEMTPGATPTSSHEEIRAIREAADAAGLEVDIFIPSSVWTGQVAKRDFMLRRAAKDSDWLLAIDADHRLFGDRDAVRGELEQIGSTVDSVTHDFRTPVPAGMSADDIEQMSPHPWHTRTAGVTLEHSLLFRRLEDMHVTTNHWGYSGVREDGVRVGVGGSQYEPAGRYHRLVAPFRFDHVCFMRDEYRLVRNREYCETRDAFLTAQGYEP